MDVVSEALAKGRTSLTEYEAKMLLAAYGIPVTREFLVVNRDDVIPAVHEIGFPVVMKGCAPDVGHKTERGVVRLGVNTEHDAFIAYDEIVRALPGPDRGVLVQETIAGRRELLVGLTRDAQFGPCVVFGLGGVFTEILEDVSFRLAPLSLFDARDMMGEIRAHKILGAVRGMAPVDGEALARIIVQIGRIGTEDGRVREIDVNPLIIRDGQPVAVDALIALG
jgi:acetyl-CoA synthetase (ADP-forming)